MGIVYKCDRCNDVYEGHYKSEYKLVKPYEGPLLISDHPVYLCPACSKALHEWMEEKPLVYDGHKPGDIIYFTIHTPNGEYPMRYVAPKKKRWWQK